MATAPGDREGYLAEFPWLGFEGHWGERQAGFFNGPTGPNMKIQWNRPITWSRESWREKSFAVPGGGALGTSATDFFCGAIAAGSDVLRRIKGSPERATLIIGGLAVLLLWGLSRTTWGPSTPLRAGRRRAWGQLLTASGRMYVRHARVFLGIGLLFVPLGLLITGVQWLIFRLSSVGALVDEAGERNAFVNVLALGLGMVFTLLGLTAVQAATAWAIVRIDNGQPVGALSAYRVVLGRLGTLLPALVVATVVIAALNLTVVLVPVAAFMLVRWSLLGVVVGAEGRAEPGVLRRSAALTRGYWWRVASIVIAVTGVALLAGPVAGGLVLVGTGAAFNVVNLIAAAIYVAALPFAAIVVTYLYFDLRVRQETAPVEEPAPAELLSSAP